MRKCPVRVVSDLRGDQRGVTALEYGLLAGVVAFALIAVLSTFSSDVAALFGRVHTAVAAVATTTPPAGG